MSINPEHVENILNGNKRFEYRKHASKRTPNKILIYCTAPVSKVVGEVEVLDVIQSTPSKIWNLTSNYSGISKTFFIDYYKDKTEAVAYKLGKVTVYKKPKELIDFGLTFAPQSYAYV